MKWLSLMTLLCFLSTSMLNAMEITTDEKSPTSKTSKELLSDFHKAIQSYLNDPDDEKLQAISLLAINIELEGTPLPTTFNINETRCYCTPLEASKKSKDKKLIELLTPLFPTYKPKIKRAYPMPGYVHRDNS